MTVALCWLIRSGIGCCGGQLLSVVCNKNVVMFKWRGATLVLSGVFEE